MVFLEASRHKDISTPMVETKARAGPRPRGANLLPINLGWDGKGGAGPCPGPSQQDGAAGNECGPFSGFRQIQRQRPAPKTRGPSHPHSAAPTTSKIPGAIPPQGLCTDRVPGPGALLCQVSKGLTDSLGPVFRCHLLTGLL